MTDLIMPHNLARQRVVSACGYVYYCYDFYLFVWHALSEAIPLGVSSPSHVHILSLLVVYLLVWFKACYFVVAVGKYVGCVYYGVL